MTGDVPATECYFIGSEKHSGPCGGRYNAGPRQMKPNDKKQANNAHESPFDSNNHQASIDPTLVNSRLRLRHRILHAALQLDFQAVQV